MRSWLDRFVAPEILRLGDDPAGRARLLVASGFLIGTAGLAGLLLSATPDGSVWIGVGAAACVASALASLWVLRFRAAIAGAAHLQDGVTSAVVTVLALLTGGSAPAVLFLGAVPGVHAAISVSLRAGFFWAALWAGVLVFLLASSWAGGSGTDDSLAAGLAFQLLLAASMLFGDTVRRARERQAAVSDERYEHLVRSAPLGICSIDTQGRILDANPALLELIGAPAGALVGASIRDTPAFAAVMKSAEIQKQVGDGEILVTEAEWTTPWGKHVLLRIHIAPFASRDGKRRGLQIICEDVAEQRRAERALLERETRHRQVLEHSTDAIAELDQDGRVLFVSSNSERILGHKPETLRARDGGVLIHPGDRERVAEALFRASAGETVTLEAYRFQHSESGWRWLETSLEPIDTEAGQRHMITTTRDVTQRVELERHLRQTHKMEAVGVLAGGIAHDFNNLLTVVVACGEELLSSTDPKARELAHEVVGAAERGAALTRRLLTFSRRADYQRKLVNLNEIAEGLALMLERLIPASIELELELSAELPRALVDPSMIEEALVNLAVNAVDAMPEGGRLVVSTFEEMVPSPEPGEAARRDLCIRVEDSGSGMSPDVAVRAFEPFFSTKEAGEGTGLGLAVVYGIAEQMGGSAEIESRLDSGTAVTLRLPSALEDTAEDPSSSWPSEWPQGAETILIAEDQPLVRRIAASALEASGYRVLVAANGDQALELAREHGDEIDLVLTDVVMPGLSGPELISRLWQDGRGPRALLMSGYPNPKIAESYPFDAEQLLRKPFTSRQLAARVRATLDAPPRPVTQRRRSTTPSRAPAATA